MVLVFFNRFGGTALIGVILKRGALVDLCLLRILEVDDSTALAPLIATEVVFIRNGILVAEAPSGEISLEETEATVYCLSTLSPPF